MYLIQQLLKITYQESLFNNLWFQKKDKMTKTKNPSTLGHELSGRATSLLIKLIQGKASIITEGLSKLSREELLSYRGYGPNTVEELEDKFLRPYGQSFNPVSGSDYERRQIAEGVRKRLYRRCQK